ncbi:restriction endonuclease subunit S [Nitrosomonas sp. wSCUT-2]
MSRNFVPIGKVVKSANTGLDAIKRAPIVERDTGIKCLRIQDVSQRKKYDDWGNTEVEKRNFEKFQLRANDIIVARTGASIGVNLIIKENLNAVLNNGLIRIRVDCEKCHSDYLYYNFRSSTYNDFIESISGGTSTQPNMQINALLSYKINLPPLEEQKAIASVLSSLDDKIDLLHRQNKTLEAMAETLFRQWFVEERANFKEGCLADIAFNIKETVKTSDLKSESKYIGLEHIDQRNISLKQYGFGSEVNSNKYAFQKYDVLFGKLRPYFHKVCFAPFSGICSTDILVIRPIKSEMFAFCLFAFFQSDVVEYANLGSGGTRMPRTDWTTLKNYPIAIPDSYSIERFNEVVFSSLNKICSNLEQIANLETLRDTLLPKLMSGEVRVDYS